MIPVAFVGLGRIASLLENDPRREKPATHAGAVDQSSECFIAGGYDIDSDRRRAFGDRWSVPTYSTFGSLLSEAEPQILVIATHPDNHERYVVEAERSRVPVVICEKPVAHTLRSARRIVAVENRGVTRIVVNHERRFSADYRLVRSAMQTGRYGRLLTLSATLHFGASQRHDLVFMHDGTHLIDAIRFVTDEELRFVRRVGVMNSNRSSVFLHAETTDSGVPVVIEVGAERRYMQFELALSCESGTIRVGNGVFEWSRADDSPFYSGYRSLRSQRRNRPEPTEYFRGMVNEAVRLVHDPAARSASRAIDGYRAVQIIQRVKRRWARW